MTRELTINEPEMKIQYYWFFFVTLIKTWMDPISNKSHNINPLVPQSNIFISCNPWGLSQQSEEETQALVKGTKNHVK